MEAAAANSPGVLATVGGATRAVAGIIARPAGAIANSIARRGYALLGRQPPAFVGEAAGAGARAAGHLPQPGGPDFHQALAANMNAPGPFTFIRSSYFISLMLGSVVVNRIHHLVPPRAPLRHPLSPVLRAAIRVPSLLLLHRAVILLSAVLLTQKGYTPLGWTGAKGLVKLVGWSTVWAGKSELLRLVQENLGVEQAMAPQIMWEVFIATAIASVSETFVRALNDDLASHTSFNLLSFSFLLHINSTPIPSTSNITSTLAPPIQLYSHLLLTLAELLTLHSSFAFTPPLPPLRLLITAFYSAIGQIFVVRGLIRMWNGAFDEDVGASIAWEGTVWLNRAPEMVFELLGLLTIALRWLAAVLRQEEVSRDTILGHPSHLPKMQDDFAIAAIRYGTACLESTRLAGLANEVSPLRILAPAPLALLNLQLPPPAAEREGEAYVELGRGVGAGEVRWRGKVEKEQREVGGLAREIRTVEAGQRDLPQERQPVRGGEILRFLALVTQICFYVVWRAYRFFRRLARTTGYGGDDATMDESWATSGPGVDVEDQEDEDWMPEGDSDEDSSASSDDEADSEDDFDPASLYRDLASPSKTSHSPHASPSNAVVHRPTDESLPEPSLLLAHHLTTSASPLTRRRYSALVSQPPTQAFSSAVEDRRLEVRRAAEDRGLADGWEQRRREELDEARQRFCVVCTVEERTIICWPCRCLALCEECRENLAQRTPAPQHLCPTCRTPVKGFSRIFIP